jgi:hypothetical protein
MYKTNDSNIVLIQKENPLSAVDKWNNERITKFSYNPSTNTLFYSRPEEYHADAIARAKDTKNFDKYVRVIYDPERNVAGSRAWGSEDGFDPAESRDTQDKAFEFFKQFDSKLKWVYDLTNDDLTRTERLDASKILDERIVSVLKKLF